MTSQPDETTEERRAEPVGDPPEQPALFGEDDLPRVDDDSEREASPGAGILAFEGDPSLTYLGCLVAASVLLLAGCYLEALPWSAGMVGIVTLLATMLRHGRWVSLAGGLAMIGIVLVSMWPSQQTLADVRAEGGAAGPTTEGVAEDEDPEGSLGIRLSEVTERWNELDQGPMIRRGLVRSPESGRFDGFVHQFDPGASLAGAYDPSTEYVHALLASIRLHHADAAGIYLHLCYMVHPYSQECIDRYHEVGLGGRALEDHLGSDTNGEWQVDGLTWRLSISGNVMDIRVVGPGS